MDRNILDLKPDFKDNPELFVNIGKIEGVIEYLRDTMDADIRRYFEAQDDNKRDMIRGHYQFAKSLVENIIRHRKENLTK